MRVRGIASICLLALAAACSSSTSGGDAGLQCPSGSVVCGSVCSDLQGDPQNCGKCGVVCAHGMICDLGACTTGISDADRETTTADAPSEGASDAATESGSTSDATTD